MQLRRFNSTRPLQGHEQEGRPHEKWAAETREQCKGIMGIADMFLIGFVFSHGKSPFLRLWERAAALFCCRPLITYQQGQTGLSTVGAAHSLAVDWLGWLCYSLIIGFFFVFCVIILENCLGSLQ